MITLSGTPILTTERLTLRAPIAQDAAAYMAFYQSERSQFVGGPVDERGAWNRFATVAGHWQIRGFGMFTVTQTGDDRALGIVGHWFPDTFPETEVGWVIFDAADEGQGFAMEAARACIDHGWNVLNWTSMVSYIDHGNVRSEALAMRLGATYDEHAATPGHNCRVFRHRRPS